MLNVFEFFYFRGENLKLQIFDAKIEEFEKRDETRK